MWNMLLLFLWLLEVASLNQKTAQGPGLNCVFGELDFIWLFEVQLVYKKIHFHSELSLMHDEMMRNVKIQILDDNMWIIEKSSKSVVIITN